MRSPLDSDAAELIARRFRVLGDPTRLRILAILREAGEVAVGELAPALGTSQQNVSKHLSALHREGYLGRRKEGARVLYRISDPAVINLCDQVCADLGAQLARLEATLSG